MKQNKTYDKVFHLSDIDLDGYTSQYLMSLTNEEIEYYNCRIVDFYEKLNQIKNEILQLRGQKVLLLITDISLLDKDVENLNNFKNSNKHIDINFQVLDHHIVSDFVSGQEWYLFDTNRCSAKITSDYILENYTFDRELQNKIRHYGDFVDAVDRWQESSPWFRKGNLVASYLYNKFYFFEEIKHFKREAMFWFIPKLIDNIKEKDILDFELQEPYIRLDFLKGKISEELHNDRNIETKDKFNEYYTNLYSKVDTSTFKIKINERDETFKFFYNLNSDVFQSLSHMYLKENKELGFMLNIKGSGSMSFRSIGANVQEIAKEYFNGGGHKEASGGRIKFNKRMNSKEEVEEFLCSFNYIEKVE